jgi:hypothetical protein
VGRWGGGGQNFIKALSILCVLFNTFERRYFESRALFNAKKLWFIIMVYYLVNNC